MKILVGIPTYDGKIQAQVLQSILNEQVAAHEIGDSLIFNILPGVSHLPMGRNQLAKNFMLSNCDRMVFLDADVSWNVGELLKVAHHSEDFVGGAYRHKYEHIESYPIGWLDKKELWANEHGLLEVESVPTGFLSLSKNAFQLIQEKYPERTFSHHGVEMYCYFEMPYLGGHLHGEDSYFCTLYRQCGGKVWLDPELNLTHWNGNQPFYGHIGKWLKNRG